VKTPLKATVQGSENVGSEASQTVVMSMGGRRLILAAPLGFRASITNPDKISLANQDCSGVLSFRVASRGASRLPRSILTFAAGGWRPGWWI
jgi:hypothetical protein